jgi:hypothetical protein
MTTYLFLAIGVWCFYHAWRGINPTGSESGKPMRSITRTIYWAGGALFVTMAVSMYFFKHSRN